MLAAVFHSIALLIALFVQSKLSFLAGSWIWFYLCGCAVLCAHGYPNRCKLWDACVLWIIALGSSCFIIRPVMGGAGDFFVLAAMPILGACLHKKDLKYYIIGFGVVLAIYATGLIYQTAVNMEQTFYNFHGEGGRSWPVLDPNNGAAILNFGVIGAFYKARNDKRFWPLFLLFLIGMLLTKSRAGDIAALVACCILMVEKWGTDTLYVPAVALILCGFPIEYFMTNWIGRGVDSFVLRFPLWMQGLKVMAQFPLRGVGLGALPNFVHNDVIQFAAEMGIPCAMAFFPLVWFVWSTWRYSNMASGCIMLAIFLESMVEFQFYFPAVSILMGLALAYHRCNNLNSKL